MGYSNNYEKSVPRTCENCKCNTLASPAEISDGVIILCGYCHNVYTGWAENLKTSGFAYDWMKTSSARKCKPKRK